MSTVPNNKEPNGAVPSKRDPNVGILDGHFAFSDDPAEFREGMLMQAEHNLVSFADTLGSLESEAFLSNKTAIKQKMQELYDFFMEEFDTYVKPTGEQGRFVLAPKPVALQYTPPVITKKPEAESSKRVAA